MIVKMNKYTFVVLGKQREEFLESLQEMGLVDVTTTGWEPGDEDRQLMAQIDRHREASEYLSALLKTDGFRPGEPYDTGAEAFEKYSAGRKEVAALEAEVARYEKMASDVRPWGHYDLKILRRLAEEGVVMRYFTAYSSEFAKKREEWSEGRILEEINTERGTVYFVVIAAPEDEVHIDAQEVKLPAESLRTIEAKIKELTGEIRSWDKVFAGAAATLPGIAAEGERLKDRLRFRQVSVSGTEAAEGSLVVMEAWAREKQEKEVDRMLDGYPDVIFLKERPAMDDETPVELKNSRFAKSFEFIGNLYGVPRYGTMDLTRWFAPFYMLFFGFCLGDAGYGLILFGGGLYLALKGSGVMKSIGSLCMWCGGTAVVFGFLCGSFFGIQLAAVPMFANYKELFLDSDRLFNLAIIVGVVQILFGMLLKVIMTSRAFGFKYALSTIGWMMTLLMILPTLLTMFGMNVPDFPKPVMLGCLGVGAFLMLFMNNPGKNPFVNLGGGLWNLYNDLTGFLSDFLSYIRLFAIGMSGGILAQVFNSLAMDMSPDIPVVKQLVTIIILLIGHGLTLFMSTLSSVVHPLRLTFVEFYKNAGFESAPRMFSPLKHTEKIKHDNNTN